MKGHVVVAPDKFKGSLTAPEVAERVAAGLGDRVRAVALPVADGGDGTVDAVVACGFTRVAAEVTGPTGERVTAAYGWRDDGDQGGPGPVAVIELAEASGLRRLSAGPAPLTATSRGTGELIADALRRGARRVVLGLGGSACTDGGAGMLQALGARLLDDEGCELPPGGAALRRLARVDVSGLLALVPAARGVEFVVASDVDNPLLGPHGAAAVYGPQKGASPDDVAILEAGLSRFARIAAEVVQPSGDASSPGGDSAVSFAERAGAGAGEVVRPSGDRSSPGGDSAVPFAERAGAGAGEVVRPSGDASSPGGDSAVPFAERAGAGAAGGVGFAAMAFLGARLRPGIAYLLELLRFDEALDGARLVITGEGSLDAQSLHGKAPVGVAEAAARHGVPVIAVCGRRALADDELRAAGIRAAYALTDLEPDPAVCIAQAGPLLERLAARIAAAEPELRG